MQIFQQDLSSAHFVLVRSTTSEGSRHAVGIDCASGLIRDSAETYPIKLTPHTLRLCCRSAANSHRVSKAREICVAYGEKGKRFFFFCNFVCLHFL